MEEQYNMADDVKLILPAVKTVLIKIDEVHKADVRTNAEAISALNGKADEANAQLAKHGELLQQILELLQRPVAVPTPSFTAMDRLSLDQALEVGLLKARSLSVLEQRMDIIALSLDNLFSSHDDDKEEEKDFTNVVAIVPTTQPEADAQRVEANEAKVVDDAITTHEAEAEVVEDAVIADAEAHDEDLPITPTVDAGDEEDEGEDDDDDSPSIPDAGKDLGGDDDEDDDDDDFMILYHKPSSALKGVSLRDSSSQGRKRKKKR
ncbi:coiled-coil domain-containing protein 1-like, partial [Cynara cardunculus var. scolymus]|uniref:coiled-coil domain-containing protein 1-like n=1 Tax=Cynara cardunculus var. scolymus TaxID=59895 RepID=UPI000D62EE52